ncbi:MAG: hypothetical protein K2Y32_24030 [Candidatus Obscuribacterales bacterium]|nr:hypothetical protein [Candidatus Obscuribacterales bacterium]
MVVVVQPKAKADNMQYETLKAHILDLHSLIARVSALGSKLNQALASNNSKTKTRGATALNLLSAATLLVDRVAAQFGQSVFDLQPLSTVAVETYLNEQQATVQRRFDVAFRGMAGMLNLSEEAMEEATTASAILLNKAIEALLDEIETLLDGDDEAGAAMKEMKPRREIGEESDAMQTANDLNYNLRAVAR